MTKEITDIALVINSTKDEKLKRSLRRVLMILVSELPKRCKVL